ncbi:MAG: hypothetical protein ACRD3J_27460 [Thermoanaerobaculia bacterium]
MNEVFFTDRDLGTRFPEILRAAGLLVERHADHFAPDTPDEEWLEAIGRRGWVALTHDMRIRYKPQRTGCRSQASRRSPGRGWKGSPTRTGKLVRAVPFAHSIVSRRTQGTVHREGLPPCRHSSVRRSRRALVSEVTEAISIRHSRSSAIECSEELDRG